MVNKVLRKLFFEKVTIAKWQLNLFGITLFTAGAVFGLGVLANEVIIPRLFAASSPWTQTDWSGGEGSSTANQYSSQSNTDTTIEGQFSLEQTLGWADGFVDWQYRKQITVTNNEASELASGYTVKLSLDHQTLVSAGQSLVSGDDIRIVYDNGSATEIDRRLVETSSWNSDGTEIWFKTQSAIGSELTDANYYLYYGNSLAGSPPSDGADVFAVWDDFNDGDISDWSSGAAGGSLGAEYGAINNKFRIDVNSGWYVFWKTDPGTFGDYEQLHKVTPIIFDSSHKLLASGGRIQDANNLYMSGRWSSNYYLYRRVSGGWASLASASAPVNELSTEYFIKVQFLGTTFREKVWEVGQSEPVNWNLSDTDSTYSSGYVGTLHYPGIIDIDDYQVRLLVSNEPTSSLGSEQTKYPSSASLVSNAFDTGFASDWGSLTFTSSGTGTVTVKVRTDSSLDMSGATGWAECSGVSSATDLSSTGCVTDTDQYVQYQVTLEPTGASSPIFESISIAFSASDQVVPPTNATEVAITGVSSGSWTPTEPTITFTPGADNDGGGGLLGYCISLDEATIGESSSLDPETTAGSLLNALDDGVSSDACPYIVTTTTIDLSAISGLTLTSGKQYYFSIKAVDIAGNIWTGDAEDYQDLVSFKYDATIPTNPAALSAPQTYQSSIGGITIYWATSGSNAAADVHSGVKGYQYKIGSSGTWYGSDHTGGEDCSDVIAAGNYTLDTDYDSLTEGENVFYFRTIDNACNASTSLNAVLKYSGNAPSEPQNLAVSPSTNTDNSFSFSWEIPATYSGQSSGITYCYSVNAVPSETTCTWTSETSLTADSYATQPSTNTIYIVAKDEAANVNYDAYTSTNFICNTSAPSVPRSIDIADISIKATSNWKLTVSWEEPSSVGAGVSSYKVYRSTTASASCTTDLGDFTNIGSTAGTSYTDTSLSQSTYYYCVKACDSANNCSAVSSTVSDLPTGKYTSASALTAGPTVSSITTKKATISWSTDRSSDSKIQYGTSSGSYFDEEVSSSTQTTDHSITLTSLSAGTTYYYRTKWTDEDGNTGTSDEGSFSTSSAPTVKEVVAKNVGLSSATIEYTVSGASKVKIYYGKTTGFGGYTEVSTSTSESKYTTVLSSLDDGTKYYYKINTFDAEDEEYAGTILDFQTLPRPKVSSVRLQEVTGTAQPTLLVTWISNTEVSSIVTYYPESDPASARDEVNIKLVEGEHRILLKGLLPDTNYILVVKGRDKIGNEASSSSQRFTTSTDTRPPALSDLRVDGSVQGSGEEAVIQLLVSFNTDEPATAQVEFGEGTGASYSQKTQEDGNLTLNHLVVISGLSPSKVYHLRAITTDKAGNTTRSVDTATITPKTVESALDLVITNLSEVFGFLGGLQ